MLGKKVRAELFFLSWYPESNKFCSLTSVSETSDKLLFHWINGLLWHEVEIMSAFLSIVIAKWNEFGLGTTLTRCTEVEHLSKGRAFVCDKEKVGGVVIMSPAHLSIGIELCLLNWLAPISRIMNHVFTIIEIGGTNRNLQTM